MGESMSQIRTMMIDVTIASNCVCLGKIVSTAELLFFCGLSCGVGRAPDS